MRSKQPVQPGKVCEWSQNVRIINIDSETTDRFTVSNTPAIERPPTRASFNDRSVFPTSPVSAMRSATRLLRTTLSALKYHAATGSVIGAPLCPRQSIDLVL
ncbi:hypothetical protein [Burkholderia sp. IMCC1007]|uniref:hypothetical protein n=1 Tax=Burkholderia sp. IMCC1007 TaxID=3004104 RepID=UPI0022B54EEA|nr:hypothetical protein [Burkholderia sp. IMCC1007]